MSVLILQFFVGVVILLFSTRVLIKLVVKLSQSLKISPLIIGTTIVALGTSLPELAVSSVALLKQDVGLAMGNVVGSNIVNILFVLPIGILIGKLRIGTTKTQRNALILLTVTGVFIASQLLSIPSFIIGLSFLSLGILFTVVEYKWAVFGRTHEDTKQFKNKKTVRLTFIDCLKILATVIGIIVGGIIVVSSAESISVLSGFSTTVIGLSLTALATSLPELFTTIFSQKRHEEKVTMGNIIGSNIYNILFIGGLIILFSQVNSIELNDWLWLLLATVCLFVILRIYKGKIVPKWVGLLLLLLFLIYLAFLGLMAFV